MTAAQTLGLTAAQMLALSSNVQFPLPTGTDSAGNPIWNDAAVVAFAATMASAASNGWVINLATGLASADFATMAVTPTGPNYMPSTDPLFDNIDSWPGLPVDVSSSSPPALPEGGAFVFSSPRNSLFAGLV